MRKPTHAACCPAPASAARRCGNAFAPEAAPEKVNKPRDARDSSRDPKCDKSEAVDARVRGPWSTTKQEPSACVSYREDLLCIFWALSSWAAAAAVQPHHISASARIDNGLVSMSCACHLPICLYINDTCWGNNKSTWLGVRQIRLIRLVPGKSLVRLCPAAVNYVIRGWLVL